MNPLFSSTSDLKAQTEWQFVSSGQFISLFEKLRTEYLSVHCHPTGAIAPCVPVLTLWCNIADTNLVLCLHGGIKS
jgi:hypothetical protein